MQNSLLIYLSFDTHWCRASDHGPVKVWVEDRHRPACAARGHDTRCQTAVVDPAIAMASDLVPGVRQCARQLRLQLQRAAQSTRVSTSARVIWRMASSLGMAIVSERRAITMSILRRSVKPASMPTRADHSAVPRSGDFGENFLDTFVAGGPAPPRARLSAWR